MKLKFSLSLLTLILISNTSQAQSAYFESKIYKDAVSIPGNTTYHLKMSFPGITIPLLYITINNVNNQVYYGDTIPNLADHNSGSDTISFRSYAINASNLFDTVGTLYTTPIAKNLYYNSKTANTPGNCDGVLNFTVDTIQGKHLPNTGFGGVRIVPTGSGFPYICSVGINNMSGLCEGEYAFGCYSFTGSITFHEYHTFLLGLNYMPVPSTMSVAINPYANAIGANCLGKARVQVSGGNPPYKYSFDNGLTFTTVDSISGLCDGVHLVHIADQQDTIAKNFIINTSANTVNNPNPYSVPVVDTIIINHADCGFNYGVPIDSASITNYYFTSPTTVYINFVLWQAGNPTFVTDSAIYPFQPNSTYMVGLIMYCGSQRPVSVTTTFNGVRVNDYIHYTNFVTTVKNNADADALATVYPNPFNTELTIVSKTTKAIASVHITNIIGETVNLEFQNSSEASLKVNTDHLSKGVYFAHVVFENGQHNILKIVKQ